MSEITEKTKVYSVGNSYEVFLTTMPFNENCHSELSEKSPAIKYKPAGDSLPALPAGQAGGRQGSGFALRMTIVMNILLFFLFGGIKTGYCQVGIGTTTPDASSILDMTSTSQGMLLSRMTTTERDAIVSPANSLLIFNTTDNCLQIYMGATTSWENVYCTLGCSGPPATPGSITGNTSPCENATGISYSIAQVAGATSYNWTVPSGATITAGQGTTGIDVNFASASGNITVSAGNNCGASAAQTLAITLSNLPSGVTALAAPNPVCEGSTLTLTGGATGATSWSWTGPNSFSSSLQSPTIAGITTAGAGIYTLTASNSCGAAAPVSTASVTVDTAPAAPTAATHTPSATQIVWNWNTVAGATGYKYNTVNTYGTATDNGASVTYTQTGLTCNTAYTLYVWAYNACGNSTETTLNQTTSACCAGGPPTSGCGGLTTMTDARDGKVYNIVEIGTQCWMAENLNYGTYVPVVTGGQDPAGTQKYCQNLSGVNDPTCPMGGLYEGAEMMDGSATCNGDAACPPCATVVQGICPTGWHVPSHYELTLLAKNVGSSPGAFPYDVTTAGFLGTDEGGNMKVTPICGALPCWNSPNTGATNSSGFTGLPGGFSQSGSFSFAGTSGFWWSSTEYINASFKWYWFLNNAEARFGRDGVSNLRGVSVRCVKD